MTRIIFEVLIMFCVINLMVCFYSLNRIDFVSDKKLYMIELIYKKMKFPKYDLIRETSSFEDCFIFSKYQVIRKEYRPFIKSLELKENMKGRL